MQRLLQSIRLGLIAPGERLPAERGAREHPRGEPRHAPRRDRIARRRGLGPAPRPLRWHLRRREAAGCEGVPPGAHEDPVELGAELEDTLALRAVIEVGTARRAASVRSRHPTASASGRPTRTATTPTPTTTASPTRAFHLLIAELLGAPAVIPLTADVRMRVNGFSTESRYSPNIALRRPAPRDRERDPAGRTRRSRPRDGRAPRGHRGAAARLLRLSAAPRPSNRARRPRTGKPRDLEQSPLVGDALANGHPGRRIGWPSRRRGPSPFRTPARGPPRRAP